MAESFLVASPLAGPSVLEAATASAFWDMAKGDSFEAGGFNEAAEPAGDIRGDEAAGAADAEAVGVPNWNGADLDAEVAILFPILFRLLLPLAPSDEGVTLKRLSPVLVLVLVVDAMAAATAALSLGSLERLLKTGAGVVAVVLSVAAVLLLPGEGVAEVKANGVLLRPLLVLPVGGMLKLKGVTAEDAEEENAVLVVSPDTLRLI